MTRMLPIREAMQSELGARNDGSGLRAAQAPPRVKIERTERMRSAVYLAIIPVGMIIFLPPVLAQSVGKEGWHIFPTKTQVLKDPYVGPYEKFAIKKDIFILQDVVTIIELLTTNGGDILIVANKVILNDPIDTRVRFRLAPDYWEPNPSRVLRALPDGPSAQRPDGWKIDPNSDADESHYTNGLLSLGYMLGAAPRAMAVYDSLYLWREAYDHSSKKFVYETTQRPVRGSNMGQPFDDDDESSMLSKSSTTRFRDFIQLPSAPVPLASTVLHGSEYTTVYPATGLNAPDEFVTWANVRSGNITIYASSIELCDDCKLAMGAITTADFQRLRDPFDQNVAIFFQASGLKGGRGGAGPPPACIYRDPGGGCNLLNVHLGGLSGDPGRGGDAGSIEFHFVNSIPSPQESKLLLDASSVKGGYPAHVAGRTARQPTTRSLPRLIAVRL
jgi:hypothetical protein